MILLKTLNHKCKEIPQDMDIPAIIIWVDTF